MQRCIQMVAECLSKAEMNRSDIHKVRMFYVFQFDLADVTTVHCIDIFVGGLHCLTAF